MCHSGVVNLLHYYRTCTSPMPAGSMFLQTMPFIFGELALSSLSCRSTSYGRQSSKLSNDSES